MPYLTLDDITMYYAIAGEGPTLALLHGAALTIETNWSNQIPVFSRKYRVVAMDLRGHGRTNNPSNIMSHNIMAEDVINLLDRLHFERIHFIGFSIGGMIATRIALSHMETVKTLILCSSGYRVSKEARDLFAKSIDPKAMEEDDLERADFYKRIHIKGGPNYWKRLLRQIIKSSRSKIVSLSDLSKINVPTLIIVGDQDPYGFTKQAIEMHNAIRGSELAIFPDMGHLIPNKKPKLFNETVLDFLERRGK